MVETDNPGVAYLKPDDEVWSATLQSLPHDVYHLPTYAALDARRSGGRARGYLYSEGDRRMLLPLVIRDVPNCDMADARSPYGYPGPVSNADPEDHHFWGRATTALVESLDANGIVTLFVRMHPLLPACYPALSAVGALVKHGETVSIDLRQQPADIWRRTRRSHRRAIEQARRSGMRVFIDDWSFLDRFVDTYHDTMVRVGASADYLFDARYFEDLRDAVADHLHLASATVEGEYVGGHLFFDSGGLANTHLGGTREGDSARGASKLLDDEVRRWLQAHGGREYHLGGGLGGQRDALYHYKLGFSERTFPFFTWRVVANATAYRSLVDKHDGRMSSSGVNRYFPAYRAFDSS